MKRTQSQSDRKESEAMSRCLYIDVNDPNRPIIPPLDRLRNPITLIIRIPGKTKKQKES